MTRIACVGGFLGAGKTTALIQAARNLTLQGLRVGVITNDQGSQLVDTALVRSSGFEAEEITGGCFCCRFKEFLTSILGMVDRYQPDFIFAEAVGSCTDLAATVYRPLQKYYSRQFELAPLCVLVEPARFIELSDGSSNGFTESISYLFQKQLAEAELIVLNKRDLVGEAEIESLTQRIQTFAEHAPVHSISAVTGQGIEDWVSYLLRSRESNLPELDLDYEIYGQAESFLGWLNATVDLVSEGRFSPTEFGESFIAALRGQCEAAGRAIAHLKILLATAEGCDRIALTTNGSQAAWSAGGKLAPAYEASMIINARVGAHPDVLRKFVEDALSSTASALKVSATVHDIESFSPSPPTRPQPLVSAD